MVGRQYSPPFNLPVSHFVSDTSGRLLSAESERYTVPIPHTIQEARASALAEQWAVATDAEMESLHGHRTWELVDPLQGCRPLDNHWVRSVKEDSLGHIARSKARRVVKRVRRRDGVDVIKLLEPLRVLLVDLSVGSSNVEPVTIMCDNEAAITLIKHPIASALSKHIDVLHHFVRERAARGELLFKYLASGANVADAMTKALPGVKYEFCKSGMGMVKL
ncbi:hypothetical protein QJQ45_003693 [Haematococcus lacustris]|nr:hypothetical protein QJQ45_003693 [Haematococcus lacustris]